MPNFIQSHPKILIVGAGAMGLITGYILQQAGVAVTYLVRPHRLETISRPQILYSYDDNALKAYDNYDCISSPDDIEKGVYDYILIALDGETLRQPDGEMLMRSIGDGARGTLTHVIVGTIGIGLKALFMQMSGLPENQVSSGALAIMAHPVKGVELPLHSPTDYNLLQQADLAYGHGNTYGFAIDDSALKAALRFKEIYNASGISRCKIIDALELATTISALFPVFAANELMDWPRAQAFDADTELWDLTIQAVREVQSLEIHGDAGRAAADATTSNSLITMFTAWEAATLPLDLPAFNRFHHGGKVNSQDRRLLQDCVDIGKSEGKAMTALTELLSRMEIPKQANEIHHA